MRDRTVDTIDTRLQYGRFRNPAGLPVGIINFANSPDLTSPE
jgi:hypothetical protein